MSKKGVYRSKKRKFHGNKYTQLKSQYKSTSSKKIKVNTSSLPRPSLNQSPYSPKVIENPVGYRLIDLQSLSEGITSCLVCKMCNGEVGIVETNVRGLGSKIVLKCKSCDPDSVGFFRTSRIIKNTKNTYEVNRRAVYAMRSIGQGLNSLQKFCGIMNMPALSKNTYNLINKQILRATKEAAKESMIQASREEVELTNKDPKTDIIVSGDGTWMRRGHTSLHGVCTVVGAHTQKIIDVEVLSSFCHGCSSKKGPKSGTEYENWLEQHRNSGKCKRNHFGSAGNMEVEGMKQIFNRSEEFHGVRYTKYIGDGDTATFTKISEMKPYGADVDIIKEECVGHVQKRMYSRLMNLKSRIKSKILSDGKKIGGKNRLSQPVVSQLCIYYGNAVRGNKNDLTNMQKAVWAVWNHKASTDKQPLHHFCPEGAESWCRYQQAVANNNLGSFKHKNTIPKAIMEEIKPIFVDLSMPNLLRKCLMGKTQNSNESFNSVLWSLCPKKGFAGKDVVAIAAYEASLVFNEGNNAKSKVLHHLNIFPGPHFENCMRIFDVRRVRDAEKRTMLSSLEVRRAKRRLRLEKEKQDKEKEGVSYAAGRF